MSKTCLAIDIGASSGRLIAGTLDQEKLTLKEVCRFENKMIREKGHFYWDIEHLSNEVIHGLKDAVGQGIQAEAIGIDTWGVDYVLLDSKNQRVCPVFAYRDHRTDAAMEKVFQKIALEDIYAKTGIQFQQFNSIFQLHEHFKSQSKTLSDVHAFLMIPDYLNYLLCNQKAAEYTNATTTQLLNIHTGDWDEELIGITGFEKDIFSKIIYPGTILGDLSKEVQIKTGLAGTKVIAPATHDTGSAVVSVPAVSEDFAYISTGTWALMGVESLSPVCTKQALDYNLTNEGGVFGTYRILKNIMGLWLIQEVQRIYNRKYGFSDLVSLAEKSEPFKCLINPNHPRFLIPENMIEEIREYCRETGQNIPETPGEIARCIFESLAFQYNEVLQQLRDICKKSINKIHIIGGGVQNKFLNQLCANFTQCEVAAGPVEATATGNLAVQFISLGEIASVEKAREIIRQSFEIEKYTPVYHPQIDPNRMKFRKLP